MCRALVFAFRDALETYVAGTNEKEKESRTLPFSYAAAARSVTRDVAFDLPCALFLTTYALLVLFWAEIYRQARPGARDLTLNPRRVFFFREPRSVRRPRRALGRRRRRRRTRQLYD